MGRKKQFDWNRAGAKTKQRVYASRMREFRQQKPVPYHVETRVIDGKEVRVKVYAPHDALKF